MKRTWFKSDLIGIVLVFVLIAGLIGLYIVTTAGPHAEAWIGLGFCLIAAIGLGSVDRSEAMRIEEATRRNPNSEESQRWATRLSSELDAQADPGDDPPKAA